MSSGALPARRKLVLPPRPALPGPGPDDPLEYYYRPDTRWFYRARLRLAMRLLGERRYGSLADAGYASGILLPELATHTERLVAFDIHPHRERVQHAMDQLGVAVALRDGSVLDIPFPDDEFEAVVCISVLEHITELERAFEEFARVLRPQGVLVIGFPTRNLVTDRLFRLLGFDPREIHPSSHGDIMGAATRSPALQVEEWRQIPRGLPRSLSAYVAGRLRAL
jgi:SAM-dependent methyltransferase